MTDTSNGEDVDGQIGELYGLPPEEFTAARDALVRTLRASGDRSRAGEVKKLRRPTVLAWTLNQLGRRHGEGVRALLEANKELRQAQRKALSGLGPAALREAQHRRRSVVDSLTQQAAGLLRERGAESHVTAIRRALEAASVDEHAAEALLEARLSQPPEAATGFDTVEGLTLLAGEQTATEPVQEDEEAEPQQRAAEEAAARRAAAAQAAAVRLAAAEEAAARAAADARERRSEAEEAARAASEAQATVERLTGELETARDHAEQARARSRDASAAAREAQRLAERLERERRTAEREMPA